MVRVLQQRFPLIHSLCAAAALLALAACDPITLTAAGVGGSAAVGYTMGGITYRTFTAPQASVKTASLGALNRMGIKVVSTEKDGGSEVLKAKATDREIEITLEALTANTTRMKVVAHNGGLFLDSATATEIILQTEKRLGNT